VTVIGCGLIGSSFALALRKGRAVERVLGWDSSSLVLNDALKLGVIDDVDQAFASGEVTQSDLIYLAMPVSHNIRFLRERIPQTKPGAIITDAGSTKRLVCQAARDYLPDNRHFVGGHPIAGSHHSGVRHAKRDLFAGATYVLTDDNSAPETESFNRLQETVEALGAQVKVLSSVDHDRALALVSHLPQLLSSALATTVAEQQDAAALIALAGPGYKDMTRLAESSWSMWCDVFDTNPAEIAMALNLLIEKLTLARNALNGSSARGDSELPALRELFK
jgi:prephenate dehydrogenase